MLDAITYSEARKNLAAIMNAVCDNIDAVVITRRKSRPVVIMSLDEYNSIKETEYLLRSPANAAWLLESIEQGKKGMIERHDLPDTDEEGEE